MYRTAQTVGIFSYHYIRHPEVLAITKSCNMVSMHEFHGVCVISWHVLGALVEGIHTGTRCRKESTYSSLVLGADELKKKAKRTDK